MIMYFKTATERKVSIHSLGEVAYAFDYTLFRFIGLTAKSLCRMTMSGFLVGATEPKKRIQLRILGSTDQGVLNLYLQFKSGNNLSTCCNFSLIKTPFNHVF